MNWLSKLKAIVATFVILTSTSVFAAVQTMECTVSDPPNMFHDMIITTDGPATTIAYSYPGIRQDKWYGPFSGVYRVEKGRVFTFDDGTEITLNEPSASGRSSGQVTLGHDGRQAEIACNAPY